MRVGEIWDRTISWRQQEYFQVKILKLERKNKLLYVTICAIDKENYKQAIGWTTSDDDSMLNVNCTTGWTLDSKTFLGVYNKNYEDCDEGW